MIIIINTISLQHDYGLPRAAPLKLWLPMHGFVRIDIERILQFDLAELIKTLNISFTNIQILNLEDLFNEVTQ